MSDYSCASSVKEDAVAKPSPSLFPIRRFFPATILTQQDVKGKLAFLQSVHHPNLDVATEAFYNPEEDQIEAVFEYLPVDVMNLGIRAFPFLKQLNLAAILGQVIQGFMFLDNAGLTHSRLVESQIMADLDGNIKIGGLFWCEKGEMKPIQLEPLTRRLMFPWLYSEDVPMDATKWPKGSPARDFWRAVIQPATSMAEISNSALTQLPWTTANVKQLIISAYNKNRTEEMLDATIQGNHSQYSSWRASS